MHVERESALGKMVCVTFHLHRFASIRNIISMSLLTLKFVLIVKI